MTVSFADDNSVKSLRRKIEKIVPVPDSNSKSNISIQFNLTDSWSLIWFRSTKLLSFKIYFVQLQLRVFNQGLLVPPPTEFTLDSVMSALYSSPIKNLLGSRWHVI